MDLVTWIKHTGLHTWLAESVGWFPYPTSLAVHSMGMGIIVGLSVAVNLRILGVVPDLPLAPLKKLFPFMWLGFWANAISGVALTFADPEKLVNWDMWIKFSCLALALVTLRLIQAQVFRNPNPEKGPLSLWSKVLAAASIFFWAGTITAGRLSAYIGCGDKQPCG